MRAYSLLVRGFINVLLDALLYSEGLLHLSLRADQDAGPELAPRHEVGALLSGPAGVAPLLVPDVIS